MMRASLIWRVGLLSIAVAIGSSRADAEIVFHEEGVDTDENLQFNDGLEGGPAATIQGLTQNSSTLVDISSIDPPNLLVKGASGAARIEGTDDLGDPDLFLGALFETPGKTFTAFEFNVQVDDDGVLTILAKDLDGVIHSSTLQAGFDGSVGNGENRFGVTADGGMKLVAVTVLLDGQIVEDIRQVRFGGIADITPVPEPSSIVLGLFAAAAGIGPLRRRWRSAVSA